MLKHDSIARARRGAHAEGVDQYARRTRRATDHKTWLEVGMILHDTAGGTAFYAYLEMPYVLPRGPVRTHCVSAP